jgi:hypothetical protein
MVLYLLLASEKKFSFDTFLKLHTMMQEKVLDE